MSQRKVLADQLKALGVQVSLNQKGTTIASLQSRINAVHAATAKAAADKRAASKAKNARQAINAISKLKEGHVVRLPLSRFNSIFERLPASGDRFLIARKVGRDGEAKSSVIKVLQPIEHEGVLSLESGSDVDYELDDDFNGQVEVEWINPSAYSRSYVGFFRYFTKVDYGLKQYQVYMDNSEIDETPCFIYALKMQGVDKDTIKNIQMSMYSNSASMKFLEQTAKDHNLYLHIHNGSKHVIKYGSSTNQQIDLGIVGDHIFANQMTNITLAALKNPKQSKHSLWPNILIRNNGKQTFVSKGKSHLTSYQVIKYLYEHKDVLLDPITQENAPETTNNQFFKCERLSDIKASEIDEEFGEEGANLGTPKHYDSFVYADFETLVDEGKHIPYAASWSVNGGAKQIATGFNCVQKMLKALPEGKSLVWFHNLGFDSRFIIKHLSLSHKDTVIESGNRMKQLKGSYFGGKKLVFQDTMAFINAPLSAMPKMFGVEQLHKECFPHNLLTKKNYDKPMLWSYVEQNFDQHELLRINAEKIDAIVTNSKGEELFMILDYAEHYCKKDVEVLETCFNKFISLIQERFNQNVIDFVSLPSLAQSILAQEGCYVGCESLKGQLLAFVREAIIGGRVMTRDNEKQWVKGTKVDDFDAVSLYPSAMARMEGFPIGPPVLSHSDPNEIAFDGSLIAQYDTTSERKGNEVARGSFGAPSQTSPTSGSDQLYEDHPFVEGTYHISRVLIKSVGKQRHFPLQPIKSDSGIRNFTNELVGQELVMDKYAIEDLIKFQEVEVEYIESLVWKYGFNAQITKTISTLFEERLRLKAVGNPLQECIKLLMNSSYGKLIQKPIVQSKKIIVNYPRKQCDECKSKRIKYTHNTHCDNCPPFKDNIKEYLCKSIKRFVSRHDIAYLRTGEVEGQSPSEGLRGCSEGAPGNFVAFPLVSHALFIEHKPIIQHSSPAHLGVAILSMSKRIMNEVMCLAEDNDLSIYYQDTDSMHIQSHQVSELADLFKEKYGRELIGKQMGQFHTDFSLAGAKGNIWATESIFLGKKCYMDKLVSDNGIEGFHCRMKGIPSKLITTGDLSIDGVAGKYSVDEIYSALYSGSTAEFDLASCCPISINNKTQVVSKRSKFPRILRF